VCLDDWLRAAESREQAVLHTSRLVFHVQSLGIIVHQLSNPIAAHSIPASQERLMRKPRFSMNGQCVRFPALLGPILVGAHSKFLQVPASTGDDGFPLGLLLMWLFQCWGVNNMLGCISPPKLVDFRCPRHAFGNGLVEGSLATVSRGSHWPGVVLQGGHDRCVPLRLRYAVRGLLNSGSMDVPSTSRRGLGPSPFPPGLTSHCCCCGAVCISSQFEQCMFLVGPTWVWICYLRGVGIFLSSGCYTPE
jgi:hypothetical protein